MWWIEGIRRAYLRRVDIARVWPQCCRQALTLEEARREFTHYCLNVWYWREDKSPDAILIYVSGLGDARDWPHMQPPAGRH